MTPVFMIGTQRSGSNLLRLMLNQLREIASPHPPHILERMYPLIDAYGNLDIDENFRMLIEDVCRLVELNPVEWSGVELNRDDVFKRAKDRSLLSVYATVYDLYAEHAGAKTWCCKSLANINYVDDIEEHLEHPRYIYLYRDGRDVALSFQKAVVGEKHIYNIAKEWAETQQKALNLRNSIDSKYFYSVSYEQLTQQPEETARSLCKFLNAQYVPEMLDFHKTKEAENAARSSELWGNVASPIIRNNSKKYQKEMSKVDLRIFESVAGPILDQLGYERDLIKAGKEIQFTDEDIAVFNQINTNKKFETMQSVDAEDKERRERQAKHLAEIKARSVA